MHLYLRLMNRAGPTVYSAEGEAALRLLLERAPGVQLVKTIDRHLKGGYKVTLEVEQSSVGALSEHLDSNGLMLAL